MSLANFNYITQTTQQFQVNRTETVSSPGYSWTAFPSTGIYNPGANMIGFVSNGSELLRIIQSGSIGIGAGAVSDPSGALLYISGNTVIPTTVINQTGQFGDALNVQVSGTTKLIVKSNNNGGFVGINTSAPTVQLHSWNTLISNTASFTPNLMGVLPIAILEEQLAAPISVTGTGTITDRQLNIIITDSLGTSVNLVSSTFTLPVGLYYIQAEGSGTCTAHRLRLINTSGVAVTVWGTSESATNAITTKSTISTILSLSSVTTLKLQTVSTGTGSLGINIAIGGNNTNARMTIIRLQ